MKNLKFLREEKGLSQQKLASFFHLSQQSIYKYENGLAEPDIETLKAFADFFQVSVDYLIGHTPISDSIQKYSDIGLSEEEQKYLNNYRKLPQTMQTAINTLIDEYLRNCNSI